MGVIFPYSTLSDTPKVVDAALVLLDGLVLPAKF